MPDINIRDSILDSVKLALDGIDPDNTDFDDQLILQINGILRILYRLGVGTKGFRVTDRTQVWSDFLGDQENDIRDMVPLYVGLKIKYYWDPPTTGASTNALKEMIDELEFTLNIYVDPGEFP
jgi:hypothetical protein